MQVIDEEGRVFGVVNIIDILVVLFILAVVVAGLAFVLGNDSSDSAGDEEIGTATVTLRAEGVQPYVADALSMGPVEDGNVTRIENVSVQPTTVYTENGSGAVLTRDHPRLKTVEIKVIVEVTDGPNGLLFGQQPLRVGKPIDIDSGTVALRGDVAAIETER
jgi:hypothetical protein